MTRLLLVVCAVFSICALPSGKATAGEPVLIELFTSQGCSSCPPADRLLTELGARDDVIALAYHVDYWDYLGWKDMFGKPAFSQRQRTYSPRVNRDYIGGHYRGAFTPELVVAGSDSLVGSSRKIIESRIAAHARHPEVAKLAVQRAGDRITVQVARRAGDAPRARVMLATYTPRTTVEISRGENAGETIDYTHIVTGLYQIGEWNGRETMTFEARKVEGAAVVFLQRGEAGRIIAAAEVR